MSFWSKIFKSTESKNSTENKNIPKKNEVKLTAEEKSKLESDINKLTEQVKEEKFTGSDSTDLNKQKADALTKLGQDYQKLGKVDEAIKAYEQSLKFNEDFGPAFDGLLKLYDVKRQEAAYAKDDEGIQKWLNKSDDLTSLSKKIMRSK